MFLTEFFISGIVEVKTSYMSNKEYNPYGNRETTWKLAMDFHLRDES